MKAHLRQVRLSPKKANLVAAMVRRMKVDEALDFLSRVPKKGARMLHKVIHSAASNAEHNEKQNRKDLYIKELIVNKGPALRRYIPMARGRSRPIDKFASHISVKLGVEVPESERAAEAERPAARAEPGRSASATRGKEEGKSKAATSKQEKAKESKEVKKEEKKVKLEAEEGAPVAHAPGNPAKQSAEGEATASGDDPHAGGSQNKQKGGEFTQFRQGSRGE